MNTTTSSTVGNVSLCGLFTILWYLYQMSITQLALLLFIVALVDPRDSVDAVKVPRISDEIPWRRNGNNKSGDKDQFPPLTAELCAAHDPTALVQSAYVAMNSPDNDIISSRFTRSTDGWMVVIVDEDDGEEDGGGTNTYGAYASFVFAGDESLADGVCDDIPKKDGDRMCDADDNSTLNFNLGPADAIAFMACTPPPARYFSYDVDLIARLTEEYPYYPGCNFGDTISNLDMNTTSNVSAGTGTGKGGMFSSPVLIIHAADAEVGEAVKEAYVSSGRIAADAVSIRYFPVDTVRLWDRSQGSSYKDSSPDIFNFIHRISVPLEGYEEEYQKYKQEIWPVKIFFAADSTTATAPTNPALKNRYSENVPNELALFSEPMSLLTQGVLNAYTGTSAGTVDGITREASRAAEESNNSDAKNNPNHQALRGSSSDSDSDSISTSTTSGVSVYKGTSVVNLTSYGFYDDWDTVLAAKNNDSFILPDRDAIYGVPAAWFGDKLMKLYADTAGVLIGVIHSLVQKASYSSVGVDVRMGTKYVETHWFLDTDLQGSALRYYPDCEKDGEDEAQYLFAIDYLPPGGCAGSAYPQWCVEFNRSSIEHEGRVSPATMVLGERVYGVLDTTIGPSANDTIASRFIVFSDYTV